MTGDSLSGDVRSFLDRCDVPCLDKPVLSADLRRAVREALDA